MLVGKSDGLETGRELLKGGEGERGGLKKGGGRIKEGGGGLKGEMGRC